MKSFVKNKKMFIILALFIGIFSFIFLNNNSKVEEKTIYKNGIKQLEYNQVQDGENTIVGSNSVTFDAYFSRDENVDGYAEKYRGESIDLSDTSKLWIELQINGDEILKDAYIEFQNTNTRIEGSIVKDTAFSETIVSNNITRIPLNEISEGTTKLFYVNVSSNLTNDITSYNANNKVVLKGTVVQNEQEIEIEKEVTYLVNWYGTSDDIRTEIERTYKSKAPTVDYAGNDDVVVTYEIEIKETKDLMLLNNSKVEALIGKLNGYNPTSVTVETAGVTYTYDEDTRKLTIEKDAIVEDNIITTQAYNYLDFNTTLSNDTYYVADESTGFIQSDDGEYSDPSSIKKTIYNRINKYKIVVTYPHNASYKTGTAIMSVDAWYEAYNNNELAADDILVSNRDSKMFIVNYQCDDTSEQITTVFSKVVINPSTKDSSDNTSVDTTDIFNAYNGIEVDDLLYEVDIAPYVAGYNLSYKIKDLVISDLGGDNFNFNFSTKNFTKYYSVKLKGNAFGTEGYIKVIDNDTGKIIHIFNNSNWNDVYFFDKDVRSVRFETSDVLESNAIISSFHDTVAGNDYSLFHIIATKQIDINYIVNNYSKSEFESWSYLQTNVRTDWRAGSYYSANDTEDLANSQGKIVQRVSSLFTPGESDVTLSLETTGTKDRLNLIIDTKETTAKYKGYKNGEFLIKIPDEILSLKVVSIKEHSSLYHEYNYENENNKYEIIERDGQRFLKIYTENDFGPHRYNKQITIDVVVDPRVVNKMVTFDLYAYNPNCHFYKNKTQDIYDVNNNNDRDEKVGYANASYNIIAPSEVISAESLTNFNDEGDVIISPLVAEVKPLDDSGDATVNVYVINNSGYAAKDIVVLGKIAFVGNTSQIGDADLHSEFDVKMTNSGITVPSEIISTTKVYYSEQETPTTDLADLTNGWTETPSNFDNVKTYMIVVNNYDLENQESLVFTYNIKIPTDTANIYKKTYFTHGVYFNAVTEQGDIQTSVGSSKLGIMMVRKYDLSINTVRTGTDKVVSKVSYEIEDAEGNVQTVVPNSNNVITISGLYVGEEYKLRQKYIVDDYVIDSEEKTIKILNGAGDILEETITGTIKDVNIDNSNVSITIENDPRFTLVLKNTDLDTDESIVGSKFTITGKGYEEGYTTITNANGELILKGLYLNEIYELEQLTSVDHSIVGEKFNIRLYFDDTTGDVKISFEKKINYPIGYKSFSDDEEYECYEYEGTPGCRYVEYGSNILYTELDLTELNEEYVLNFSSYNKLKIYVYDYMPETISDATPVYNYNYTNNTPVTITNYYDAQGNLSTIVGGKKYYILVETSSYYSNFYELPITTVSGDVEFVVKDELSSLINNDEKIIQTLDNNINNNQPILNVKIKNPGIPSSTLKIVKRDAESGDTLAGATYRLEGPGIFGNGVILTTDSNGEATYNIYQHYIGNYEDAGLENLFTTEKFYSLEELSAPEGYAKDNTKVYFRLDNKVDCPNGDTCAISEATYDLVLSYQTDDEFKSYSYDEINNILNVDVYDYPLIKIVKTDAETSEPIANAFFAIYQVQISLDGTTYSDALDVNGNVVGERYIIDGQRYNVITTDSEGRINLNLQKGQYLVKEVQATDDKYEISTEEYYFGVGESIPLQAEGVIYDDSFASVGNISRDGGYYGLVNEKLLKKYDHDGNLEWAVDLYDTTNNGFDSKILFTYYDKPDTYEFGIDVTFVDAYEQEDGSFIVPARVQFTIPNLYSTNAWNGWTYTEYVLLRYSSQGELLTPKKVVDCRVEFYGRRAKTNYDYAAPSYVLTENENEIYEYDVICEPTDYTDTYNGHPTMNNSEGSYPFLTLTDEGNGNYAAMYYGRTMTPRQNGSACTGIIAKYNSNNELINSVKLYDLINPEYQRLYDQVDDYRGMEYTFNCIDYHDNTAQKSILKHTPDGGLIFVYSYLYDGTAYVAKVNSNLELDFFTPINLDGKTHGVGVADVNVKEDGSYVVYATFSEYSENYTKNKYAEYNMNVNYSPNNRYKLFALEYDKDGNPIQAVVLSQKDFDEHTPETNKYIIKNNAEYYSSTYRFNQYGSKNVIYYDNGYIVARGYTAPSSDGANRVILASGETVEITGNFIVYKVNEASKVEWIKQYNTSSYSGNIGISNYNNNNYVNILIASGTVKDQDNNIIDQFDTYNSNTSGNGIMRLKISDFVTPSGPEEYTLNIENKRKEFNINVISDEGSTVSIKNKYGVEIYNGNGETVSEKVKYGDNSVNEITITLNPNTVLSNVKLNGLDFSYKVNDDGTITLDKIPNIQEEKTITIETKQDMLSIVVHHYKENTTERIASDEIIRGFENKTYTTSPVISNVYSVITDEHGDYIMPSNYTGTFGIDTDDVIYYYKESDVLLNVNYVEEETEQQLAEPSIERRALGTSYQTTPINIDSYRVTGVRGNEQGRLNRNITSVTYLYGQTEESTIIVKHVDVDTGLDIIPQTQTTVERGTDYTTTMSSEIPANYRYVSTDGVTSGPASDGVITVIYYFEVIPYNVSVEKNIKSISINGENIQLTNNKTISLGVHSTDSVVVTYEIVLTNDSDVDVDFDVIEEDVDNFEVSDLGLFTATTDGYVLSVTLEAGQTVSYEIEYTWDQEHFGSSTNHVELDNVDSDLTFDEPDEDDNESETTITLTSIDAFITVKHEDVNTHEEIAPRTYVNGTLNESYQTSASSSIPANYKYVDRTANAEDVALTSEIEVTYYYDVISYNISVEKNIKSISVNGENIQLTNNKTISLGVHAADSVVVTYEIVLTNDGEVDVDFDVLEEDIDNFEVSDLGLFAADTDGYVLSVTLEAGQIVTYEIEYTWDQEHFGSSTNHVELDNVDNNLGFDEPDEDDNESETTVTLTSVDSLITVKHEDINTHEEIAPRTYVNGTLNEAYQTSVSTSIPANYRYASKTANAEDVALTSSIEVIYYYEVIPFNVSVDKKIDSIQVNGENINISDNKTEKINVTNEDEVIVYYEIELENSGELKAEFKISEEDVDNFEIYDLGDFEESNGEYILTTTLEPGETKTYKIGYKWKQGEYGISTNRVEVDNVTNELGFDEPDEDDNISMTAILVQAKDVLGERTDNPNTSDNIYKFLTLFIISYMGLLSVILVYIKKKKFEI